ncbi:MAG: TlpA family protein disulfide reductase, partial [Planctomycetaceae bacterium]|nr:TlpA family protein disulfide reductase [Planctomycetaceae bacterium]
MSRLLTAGLMLVGLVTLAPAQDTEKAQDTVKKAEATPLQQAVLDDPDDADALRKYAIAEINALRTLLQSDPDAAEKRLNQFAEFTKALDPKDANTKRLLGSVNNVVKSYEQQITLARLSLDDLKKQLDENPDDTKAVGNYAGKLAMMMSPIVRSEPEKAEQLMKQGQKFLNGLKDKAKEDATKRAIQSALTSIGRYERTIEGAMKLAKLIGTQASKLEVEAWVNGKPLTDEDLKGKVVLLDFWAVWCGPCVATFPHLRDWDKKYDDLVIIGVTNYHQYIWDEKAERAKRSKDVSEEAEQDMLVQFAKHHKLTHRFALESDRKLTNHYGASAIPEAVLIDRQGKVRLIKVGSGEANATAIEEMIEKLIEE